MPAISRMALDLLARPERHRYGKHRCHRADLSVPDGDAPHPVVVTIHGGFWRARYGKALMKAVAADLVRRGHAVWNIEYRRLGRGQGGGWPTTFDDVSDAIDHLAELDDPRLDLSAVTAVGHSAGGQLALWAAARSDARVPIRRVVAQAAVSDLPSAGGAARDLLGGSPDEVPERYAAVDPLRLLPLGVEVLLVHGSDDETVSVGQSRRYRAAARAAGDAPELIEPSPGGHRTHIDPRSKAWEAAARWLSESASPRSPG